MLNYLMGELVVAYTLAGSSDVDASLIKAALQTCGGFGVAFIFTVIQLWLQHVDGEGSMSDSAEQDEILAQKLENMNLEVRRYTANVYGQLAVGFTVTGVLTPGLQVILNKQVHGGPIIVMLGCWALAFILYLSGEYQLTKGDK